MGWYLMVKSAGDLKYLCKCVDNKNHLNYKGSGVYWRRYLKKHPDLEISTTVLGWYDTPQELRAAGEFFSTKYDIVHDTKWANLIEEIGDGGATVKGRVRAYCVETLEQRFYNCEASIPAGWVRGAPKWSKTTDAKEKTRQFHTGRVRSKQTRENMKNSIRSKRMTVACTICSGQFTKQNIVRHERICTGA